MHQEILLHLLTSIAGGTYTTRELIEISGYSPNTVIRYLDELEGRGLIERMRAKKPGRGRPPVVRRPTERGLSWMRGDQVAVFNKLRREAGVLWGPRRSFSFWGVPFYGQSDIFATKELDATPFELVVERRREVYANPIEREDGVYPSIESLAAWAATSNNPRYLGATAVLLKNPRLDVDVLLKLAARIGSWNRLGFLASLSGATRALERIPPPKSREKMLPSRVPVDRQTEKLARRWKVDNPVSEAVVKEMVRLYGSAE